MCAWGYAFRPNSLITTKVAPVGWLSKGWNLGFGSELWGQTVKRLRSFSMLWLSAVMGSGTVTGLGGLLLRGPMQRQVHFSPGASIQPRLSFLHMTSPEPDTR